MSRRAVADTAWAPFDAMRFPLSYEGPLPSGNAHGKRLPKLPQIWTIRNAIHPQIQFIYGNHPAFISPSSSQSRAAMNELNKPIVVGGHKFYPLGRAAFHLRCELDIEMHVNHPIASLITNVGDLDNRLKIVFDALRMPGELQEIQNHMPPNIDDYCCLLENDILISALRIEMFRHTAAPIGADTNHVRLNIKVRLEPIQDAFINEPFRHD